MHRTDLVSKLDYTNSAVQQQIQGMQQSFISKAGYSADKALKAAYAAMDGKVMKQAAVLSYMDVFLYLGIAFLLCVPFIILVRGNKKKKVDLGEAMH
ncbi:hypothetical protein [Ferruginibacter sp.]